MLKKKPTLIITFTTTTQAMSMEKFCTQQNLPGRLIPVPREITAGCGLSWKARPEDKDLLITALTGAGMKWAECHILEV
jgi:hypothetical protein